MPPQIVIVSSPAEAAPARELIRETGLNAEVLEAADETVVSEVQAAFGENAGVAVARGRLAALLKEQKAVPVVEAVLSAQDMADLLEKACLLAGREHLRVAFVGQRYMFSNPETFARILGAEADIHYIGEDSELPDVLLKARAAGTDCIVGDDFICAAANKAGFQTVSIRQARDGMLSALRTATRLAEALRREQRRLREIRYLIRFSSDAIFSLNAEKKIRAVNPRAEKALGGTEAALVGRKWEDIEGLTASEPLRRALEKTEPSYGVILQFSSTSYVANILPVIHEEQTEGWLITMQEFAAIEDLDERVRQEKRRRGFVARAHFADFPARSPAMKALIAEAEAYAPYEVPVLITGEPRLAKSRLAECIHNASLRRRNPYVAVDLGTIPPENQFGVLFGQRGGGDIGLVGQAHKGTLFLLDVHMLAPDCQRQLLSILRYNNFRRRDSLEPIPVSVRVVCSTFMDLKTLAEQDRFMWQLVNTLLGVTLRMPPIRETPEDIPAYLQEYMDQSAEKYKKRVILTDEALAHLCRYPWNNNLRDIEYFALRATMLAPGPVIGLDFIREKLLPDMENGEAQQQPFVVAGEEELAVRRALREAGGSRTQAAEALGISRATLWRKMKKYGLEQ